MRVGVFDGVDYWGI